MEGIISAPCVSHSNYKRFDVYIQWLHELHESMKHCSLSRGRYSVWLSSSFCLLAKTVCFISHFRSNWKAKKKNSKMKFNQTHSFLKQPTSSCLDSRRSGRKVLVSNILFWLLLFNQVWKKIVLPHSSVPCILLFDSFLV